MAPGSHVDNGVAHAALHVAELQAWRGHGGTGNTDGFVACESLSHSLCGVQVLQLASQRRSAGGVPASLAGGEGELASDTGTQGWLRSLSRVISDFARKRMGGPQYPVPLLT